MVGVITHWDVLGHPVATIRCFGWPIFFRAASAWQGKTFLDLLRQAGWLGAATPTGPKILERCIGLELRAKRIYQTLAKAFSDQGLVEPFFAGLIEQEQYHADLLGIARAASTRSGWKANIFNPWQEYLPRLEQQMEAAEAAVASLDSVEAALQLVIQIESSEINQVFYAALAATDAAFIKKLKPFREAMEAHMSYLAERLSELSPQLKAASSELRGRFPRVPR
jgi:hypothetical protein